MPYFDITFIFDISYESSVVICFVRDNLSTAIGEIDGIGTCNKSKKIMILKQLITWCWSLKIAKTNEAKSLLE